MKKFIIIIVLFVLYPMVTLGQELELHYEFLFDLTATNVGQTPFGERVIYPVNGGSFEGLKKIGLTQRHSTHI